MSSNYTAAFQAITLQEQARVLRRAACSADTVRALAGSPLALAALPGALSTSYRKLQPRVAASLRAAGLPVTAERLASLVEAAALDQALQASPLGAVVGDLCADRLAEARSLEAAAETRARAGDEAQAEALAAQAHDSLVAATLTAHEQLRVATNEVALEDLVAATRSVGFEVATASDGAGNHTLWAWQGDHQLAAVIHEAGALEVDVQGYAGTECVALQTALGEALRARGWHLELADTVLHQRREGGALIAEAARLARERQCSPQEALLAAAGSAAPREAETRDRLRRALLARARTRQQIR